MEDIFILRESLRFRGSHGIEQSFRQTDSEPVIKEIWLSKVVIDGK